MTIDTKLACIGGTVLHELIGAEAVRVELIPTRNTPFGCVQGLYRAFSSTGQIYLLATRQGHYGDLPRECPTDPRALMYALRELGICRVIGWSDPSALTHNLEIGQYVLVHDLIDLSCSPSGSFFAPGTVGAQIRQWPTFCRSLRSAMGVALHSLGIDYVPEGVYMNRSLCRRETAAETSMFESMGGHLLGSDIAGEVFLARELQMCYASLCYVNDYAETGSMHRPFAAAELLGTNHVVTDNERVAEAIAHLPRIVDRVIEQLEPRDHACACTADVDHMIHEGVLDKDWRTWFDQPE